MNKEIICDLYSRKSGIVSEMRRINGLINDIECILECPLDTEGLEKIRIEFLREGMISSIYGSMESI
jgi:hypothetical protein